MKNFQTIIIANDHAGLPLTLPLKQAIKSHGLTLRDLGTQAPTPSDYPDFVLRVVDAVLEDPSQQSLGLLICGSGIGMSMAANRFRGIRAALCRCPYEAQLARQHNDANVLCLGARIIGPDIARACLEAFLAHRFEGGRHRTRLQKFSD